MYNPEKQSRAGGGRFGGKKVAVATVVDDVQALGADAAELASDAAAVVHYGAVDLLDTNDDGEINVNDVGKASIVTIFAFVSLAVAGAALLVRCIG